MSLASGTRIGLQEIAAQTRTVAVWVVGAVSCLFVASCHHNVPRFPFDLQRAIVVTADVQGAIDAEQRLSLRYDQLPGVGDQWLESLPGCSQVLVTAPHATQPMREGRLRFADVGTGSLAIALNRVAGVRAIHTSRASPSDPNFYDDNEFKATLEKELASRRPILVLDLHASHQFRPYDVDFGTMNGKSLIGQENVLRSLATHLAKEGLVNQSIDYFAAAANATVTKWVASRGVTAIQLEINATWLDAGGGELAAHRFAQLLQGLTRFVRSLKCAPALAANPP